MLYLRLLTIAVIGFTVSTSQTLLKSGHECRTDDIRLNLETPSTLEKCNEACLAKPDCTYFIYGTGDKEGRCYHELTGSYHDHELTNDPGCEKGFEEDSYNFYKVGGGEICSKEMGCELLMRGHECRTTNTLLDFPVTLKECNEACWAKSNCTYFIYGTGYKKGWCYHEHTSSRRGSECDELKEFEEDAYNFYKVGGVDRKCGQSECWYAVIGGNAECTGHRACREATINGDAECTGYYACREATIKGDTKCAGGNNQRACRSAVIQGDANCTGEDACWGARIQGDANCTGEDACRSAVIQGVADCTGEDACRGATIKGGKRGTKVNSAGDDFGSSDDEDAAKMEYVWKMVADHPCNFQSGSPAGIRAAGSPGIVLNENASLADCQRMADELVGHDPVFLKSSFLLRPVVANPEDFASCALMLPGMEEVNGIIEEDCDFNVWRLEEVKSDSEITFSGEVKLDWVIWSLAVPFLVLRLYWRL